MGFGFLLVLISLVALSTEKVIPDSGEPHDKRSAPDPLLGELFNDPSATSLSKGDLNDNDISGSGTESGAGVNDKSDVEGSSIDDSGTQTKSPLTTDQATDTQDSNKLDISATVPAGTVGSGSGSISDSTADQTKYLGETLQTKTNETKTHVTLQKNSFVPSHTDSYTEQFKESDIDDSDSFTATQQGEENLMYDTTRVKKMGIPNNRGQNNTARNSIQKANDEGHFNSTHNSTVQTGATTVSSKNTIPSDSFETTSTTSSPVDSSLALSKSSFEIPRDKVSAPFDEAPKSSIPMDSNSASFVSSNQIAPNNNLMAPLATTSESSVLPNVNLARSSIPVPISNNAMATLEGTRKSSIPASPKAVMPKSSTPLRSGIPYKGSFPLQLHKHSPFDKLKTGTTDIGRTSVKKSKVAANPKKKFDINAPFQANIPQPSLNSEFSPEAPAFFAKTPFSLQSPDQAQADSSDTGTDQQLPQMPASGLLNNTQAQQAMNPMNATQFSAMAAQPVNDELAAQQDAQPQQPFYDQALQAPQTQAGFNNQTAMAPEMQQQLNDQFGLAAQQQQQIGDQYGVAPQQPMVDQYGQPITQPQQNPYGALDASQQSVPVYQGQTPKKPFIDKDECADQFETCPQFAKNGYCKNYKELMMLQCKKSCHFCEPKKKPIEDKPEGSGNIVKDHSGSGLGDYVWSSDSMSGSGEGIWDSSASGSDDMENKKSAIPSGLLKKVVSPKQVPNQDTEDSGSAASGSWDTSGAGSEVQQQLETEGESGSGLEKRNNIPKPDLGSGSGDVPQQASEIESGSGAELAEDLATGTISKNVKHSEIPAAPVPEVAPAVAPGYRKIDLKEIAKAVSLYKHVALKMLGEAIRDEANEIAEEEAKRNNIPSPSMPTGTEILQDMGFPVEDPRSEIPSVEDQDTSEETLNNFYGQQQPNVPKSDIVAPEQNTTESDDSKDDKKTDEDSKKSDLDDPYQYVRNLGKGASLEPIFARPGANLNVHGSSSQPLILHKNSQWPSVMAKKKEDIPRPVAKSAVTASQKYSIPQTNMTADTKLPDFDSAQAYSQYTPENQLLTGSPTQEANLRSDLTAAAEQDLNQALPQALMDKGTPSQASIDKAVIKTFFNKEPEFPKPKPFTFNGDTGSKVHASSGPLATMFEEKSPQITSNLRESEGKNLDNSLESLEDALQNHNSNSDNLDESDIDGSLSSSITSEHAQDEDIDNGVNAFVSPQVEISGKVANDKNIDRETQYGQDESNVFLNGGSLKKAKVSTPESPNKAIARGRGSAPGNQASKPSPSTVINTIQTGLGDPQTIFSGKGATSNRQTFHTILPTGRGEFSSSIAGGNEASQFLLGSSTGLPSAQYGKKGNPSFITPLREITNNKAQLALSPVNHGVSNAWTLAPLNYSDQVNPSTVPFINPKIENTQNQLTLSKPYSNQVKKLTISKPAIEQPVLGPLFMGRNTPQTTPVSFINLDLEAKGKQHLSNPYSFFSSETPSKVNVDSAAKQSSLPLSVNVQNNEGFQTASVPFLNQDTNGSPSALTPVQGIQTSKVLPATLDRNQTGFTNIKTFLNGIDSTPLLSKDLSEGSGTFMSSVIVGEKAPNHSIVSFSSVPESVTKYLNGKSNLPLTSGWENANDEAIKPYHNNLQPNSSPSLRHFSTFKLPSSRYTSEVNQLPLLNPESDDTQNHVSLSIENTLQDKIFKPMRKQAGLKSYSMDRNGNPTSSVSFITLNSKLTKNPFSSNLYKFYSSQIPNKSILEPKPLSLSTSVNLQKHEDLPSLNPNLIRPSNVQLPEQDKINMNQFLQQRNSSKTSRTFSQYNNIKDENSFFNLDANSKLANWPKGILSFNKEKSYFLNKNNRRGQNFAGKTKPFEIPTASQKNIYDESSFLNSKDNISLHEFPRREHNRTTATFSLASQRNYDYLSKNNKMSGILSTMLPYRSSDAKGRKPVKPLKQVWYTLQNDVEKQFLQGDSLLNTPKGNLSDNFRSVPRRNDFRDISVAGKEADSSVFQKQSQLSTFSKNKHDFNLEEITDNNLPTLNHGKKQEAPLSLLENEVDDPDVFKAGSLNKKMTGTKNFGSPFLGQIVRQQVQEQPQRIWQHETNNRLEKFSSIEKVPQRNKAELESVETKKGEATSSSMAKQLFHSTNNFARPLSGRLIFSQANADKVRKSSFTGGKSQLSFKEYPSEWSSYFPFNREGIDPSVGNNRMESGRKIVNYSNNISINPLIFSKLIVPYHKHKLYSLTNVDPVKDSYHAKGNGVKTNKLQLYANFRNPYLQLTNNTHALLFSKLGARTKTFHSYPPPVPLSHAQSPKDVNFYHSNLAEGQGARYKVTTDAYNNFLPPLNHATSGVLPPLNHGRLPPLNHKFTSENGYSQEDKLTGLPPLNHGYLPPLNHKYASENLYKETTGTSRNKAPPIYPFTIPPEGEQASQRFSASGKYKNPMQESGETRGESWPIPNFPPEGDGKPYPLPLPPEGDNADDLKNTDNGGTNANAFSSNRYSFDSTIIPEEPYTESKTIKKNLIRPKPDLKCGDGWKGAYGDFGTFCYKEVYDHKTWDDAHGACKELGGDLFSVKNAYEQRFLENFTNTESWIGYRDKSIDGTWRWSDGDSAVYTNWDSSAVDDRSDRRDCVILDAKKGKWRDAPCSQKHNFICKRNSDDCIKGWKRLSLNNVKGCYKLMNGTRSWEDAEGICVDQGGNLASILSDDEQTMVAQVYSNENLWIGYNDKDNEGDWVWTDRMTSSYTNWDDKSPNNGGVTCAIVTRQGGWHDESCRNKYSFICRKPSPKDIPKYIHDMLPPVATLVANKSLNPELDDSVSIFGKKSVAPINFWTAQKIFNNKIHGSNPIAVHGNIQSVNGGLQLSGKDSWLDAGDFFGQCLGDPDLCIKGFSYALQLNFDDDVKQYKDKRYVLDSSGGSRGMSVYIENGTVHYKVVTSSQTWDLETDLASNEWQDIVLTWKKEEGLMLYVNGAFRDSLKEGKPTDPVPNKQARLTIGRKSDNPPYKYTRMYISSLLAFTRFLAPEDIPYVFTYDDTVVPRYMWLLPKIENGAIPGSPDIDVNGPVKAVDGGVHLDGQSSYLKIGGFKGKCLHNPEKCTQGLSFSCKLKFNRVVRSYKTPHYILDSGGHKDGARGISAYLLNNNLYFDLAVSSPEDTLTWTVRTNIYTVRWQRVALTWSLEKGLWLYIDNQFRSYTKRPRSKPRDIIPENSDFLIGRKNIGDNTSPAEFSIGSIGVFERFLDPEKKEIEKIFGGKKMPYPGLIREVWKDLGGSSVAKLKDDPYFPNDPSLIEIIENFDSPFDVEKDYGTKVRGYFVAPETGNYTFYLAGSKSGELFLSKDESESNLTSLVNLDKPTGHNQWNKYAGQISATVSLEAGKYYYITALQKGTESTDSLSAGVRLPSGRFMRPVSKEVLQWRLPGDPFAGVIREVWKEISGYKITDLTSNPDFPNNPSSIEVLDKFDAPYNVDDSYGSRIRGFFKAPETGFYRFFLAADSVGELWLSTDESERNLKKIVIMTGWTDHNEWLKFREQKSEKIHLKKGKFYFLSAYHKADKLADCVSVAVEFPNGHFEGPIKKTHLSWRLPDGKTGPGPSFEQEAIPKPVGLFPFTKFYKADDVSGNAENGVLNNVELGAGPNDRDGGAYQFKGTADSYIEIPNTGKLDTRHAMTILANVYPTGNGGPIVNYMKDGWGVHLWQFENNELFVRFVHRDGVFHKPIGSRVLQIGKWNQVGATYDNNTGVAQLWHNGKMVKSRNIGNIELATQYSLRIGSRDGDERHFAGKITCLQIYDKALDESQIGNLKACPVKAKATEDSEVGSGSGSGAWEGDQTQATEVSPTHTTGRFDKDDEAEDEIQGTDTGSTSKCSPNPCENSAECVRDNKRIDGYRCKCTSDFTGRNCQVSKPDADNPVMKRTEIPKVEKKTSSADFQKNSPSINLEEQIREEKKEDVFLLFQKIGCYNDNEIQHDLPDPLTLKSVSQEDCARACALEEKGYSFFGLQNANQCYCGHHYGKYGKAEDSMCNMKCRDNKDENCGGKTSNVVYFFGLGTNYTVTTYTGDEEGADTDANVYVTLYGEKGDSGFRKLSSKHYVKGKHNAETLILPDLGQLKQMRVLHDNTGAAPSWYLDKVTVTDENGKVYTFPCKEWLSETQGGGKTERLLRLSNS